ncbi:MAG: ACT domain-containing protein [Verrucomicrobiota bacterium]
MNKALIVSVIGPDRPGLVEQLSQVVTAMGGNWEGSRLVQLGGQFAGMVRVVIDEEKEEQLHRDLDGLKVSGLTISVIHAGDSGEAGEASGEPYELEVVGQDRSGIVAAIAKELASDQVNVIELATDCRPAPWSGETHFHTTAKIAIPSGLEVDTLRQRIESIAGDLMVEITPTDS